MTATASPAAYGFRLVWPEAPGLMRDLRSATPADDRVEVAVYHAASRLDVELVTADRVLLGGRGNGLLDVERAPARVALGLPEENSADAVVHPLLTLPLAMLAHWRGDSTIHGGAFVAGGQAWVVTGPREAGKSSLLAGLAARGVAIAADDLVVVGPEGVRSGPACVDLRPDAARRYPQARSLGMIADRERHRLAAPPAPAVLPFGGLFELAWDSGPARFAPLAVPAVLDILHEQHYGAHIGPPPPEGLLTLLDRPAWRFSRPRDWTQSEAVLDIVLEHVAAYPAPAPS